ncbi:hypothetical protein PAXRUDRAFT_22427 [Paxillus rubicundulus Ve08.2h10]|uniref:Uncharacterized protein n=1 Tax=Paxillus rubicundulus Ve08.2h10 TaxID=930991 RepID=A0A0D0CN55_9AGAM|nr:hypothetical protein PAXRUDRAFT_22427 [Paxillus rubicundulus Ve08.2h10]
MGSTLKGSFRRFSSPLLHKQPLTRAHLLNIMDQTPRPITHDHLLFRTQVESGFFGLLRLGELVWPDKVALRDFLKLSMRLSVLLTDDTYRFDLVREKSDDRFEGNVVLTQRSELSLEHH